jgi:hypothetical protein
MSARAHPFSPDHAKKVHGHTPAVTAQPIHMIYQENVADNRMKGMTYAALTAPLTRPAIHSPFKRIPPSRMADGPPRPVFPGRGSRTEVLAYYRVPRRRRLAERLANLMARDPAFDKDELPADSKR